MNIAVKIIKILATYAYFVLAMVALALLTLCIGTALCFLGGCEPGKAILAGHFTDEAISELSPSESRVGSESSSDCKESAVSIFAQVSAPSATHSVSPAR